MVGILCNLKDERRLVKNFRALLSATAQENEVPILIFTAQNINLRDGTVLGKLVTGHKAIPVKRALPKLVFNLSVQHRNYNIKNLRKMMEIEEISLINPVNQYDQYTIMEMLSSSGRTKKYTLPHLNYLKEEICGQFPRDSAMVIKPPKGTNLSKLLYVLQSDTRIDVYNGRYCASCRSSDVFNTVSTFISGRKLLLLKVPELMSYRGQLYVKRVYLQKQFNRIWKVIPNLETAETEEPGEVCRDSVYAAALEMIQYVNCFIFSLGVCFIDFVFDKQGRPYFLQLGGWDSGLLNEIRSSGPGTAPLKNMLEYAKEFKDKQKGDSVCGLGLK